MNTACSSPVADADLIVEADCAEAGSRTAERETNLEGRVKAKTPPAVWKTYSTAACVVSKASDRCHGRAQQLPVVETRAQQAYRRVKGRAGFRRKDTESLSKEESWARSEKTADQDAAEGAIPRKPTRTSMLEPLSPVIVSCDRGGVVVPRDEILDTRRAQLEMLEPNSQRYGGPALGPRGLPRPGSTRYLPRKPPRKPGQGHADPVAPPGLEFDKKAKHYSGQPIVRPGRPCTKPGSNEFSWARNVQWSKVYMDRDAARWAESGRARVPWAARDGAQKVTTFGLSTDASTGGWAGDGRPTVARAQSLVVTNRIDGSTEVKGGEDAMD